MHFGERPGTYPDVDDLIQDVGFKPATKLEDGVSRFVDWYKAFYKIGCAFD